MYVYIHIYVMFIRDVYRRYIATDDIDRVNMDWIWIEYVCVCVCVCERGGSKQPPLKGHEN